MRLFDIEKWIRKTQYEFFMDYEDPYFGIMARVDVSNLLRYCKKEGFSFFLASLYCSTRAANAIENFRMRIIEEKVYIADELHVGTTILKKDKTFSFCYLDIENSIRQFCEKGRIKVDQQLDSEVFDDNSEKQDLIYYSVIPWVSFTAIKHPMKKDASFSIPRITFGKYAEEDKGIFMPVSVEVHHALMDGYHVGRFFELFQKEMDLL